MRRLLRRTYEVPALDYWLGVGCVTALSVSGAVHLLGWILSTI